MKNGPKLDIEAMSINDLLAGLDSADAPAGHADCNIATWLAKSGIYPGTTRVRACELYEMYRQWRMDLPDYNDRFTKIEGIRAWGKVMARKFKAGRGKQGIFYYVSRETVVEIPPSLQAGGVGTWGGGNPVPAQGSKPGTKR